MTKYCTDCAHHRPDTDGYDLLENQIKFSKCVATVSCLSRYDLVTPYEAKIEGDDCAIARSSTGQCGPDAKMFEPMFAEEV